MPELPSQPPSPSCSATSSTPHAFSSISGARYAEVLAEYRRLLRETFQAEDGYEIDTAGDGFFVAFQRATPPWPRL